MTAGYQRHPSVEGETEKKRLFLPFEACCTFMLRGLKEVGKNLFPLFSQPPRAVYYNLNFCIVHV